MDKIKYWVGLSSIEQIDSTFIQRLYNYFGDIEQAFNANINELSNIDGLSIRKANSFLRERDKINLEETLERVVSKGIEIITFDSEKYPYRLKQISNPPSVLYVKGDLDSCNLDRAIAVVGSRKASSNGKDSLKRIIKDFQNTDICIVSGLAEGIDAAAHTYAIENNLRTIGVIASGFDFTYPKSSTHLYKKMMDGKGAVISEYYPTFEPLKFRFPQRNRIVTGLSLGTLVVEAALRSGALISANLTLEQGRELMCVPGLISNPNTEGIFKLLKDGALMVTQGSDIMNALNWEINVTKEEKLNISNLTEAELKIMNTLEIEPKNFDTIQAETELKTSELLTALTTLELKGIIEQGEGDRYLKV